MPHGDLISAVFSRRLAQHDRRAAAWVLAGWWVLSSLIAAVHPCCEALASYPPHGHEQTSSAVHPCHPKPLPAPHDHRYCDAAPLDQALADQHRALSPDGLPDLGPLPAAAVETAALPELATAHAGRSHPPPSRPDIYLLFLRLLI